MVNEKRTGNELGNLNRKYVLLRRKERKQEDLPTTFPCCNCNQVGHSALQCPKPQRSPGSCYECGSTELLMSCPKRKSRR